MMRSQYQDPSQPSGPGVDADNDVSLSDIIRSKHSSHWAAVRPADGLNTGRLLPLSSAELIPTCLAGWQAASWRRNGIKVKVIQNQH